MGERGKERGVASADPLQPHYGTFQGVTNYPPLHLSLSHPQPAIGFPQPVPPPSAFELYANAYQLSRRPRDDALTRPPEIGKSSFSVSYGGNRVCSFFEAEQSEP
ncbi:hypothetical protein LOK49_LG01G03128 [Camellia lanceoleosa]|uniref:Uncharacterized protein n=1 Tax=Camellia lanceoleosa TaxID=1840588 RepID=A0ACC0IYJ3_9ERIC|nr:hypothetical protein LOK49_LG01G03128 [Camellia lanceoleosa]